MLTFRMNVALDSDQSEESPASGTEFLRTDDTLDDICAQQDSDDPKIEVEE